MNIRTIAVAAAMALSAAAHAAAPVFSDNFDANVAGTDRTPTGWTLSAGTNDVDIIGNGFFDFLPGNGLYIDLGGSNAVAGAAVLSTSFAAVAGTTYTATFHLAGNHRDGVADAVTVMFGDSVFTTTPGLDPASGFTAFSITTTATGDSLSLSFADSRAGNVGALLDNVSVSSVPEAGNLSLMLAGLAALGVVARRRRA